MRRKRAESPDTPQPAAGDARERLRILKRSSVLRGLDDSVLKDLAARSGIVEFSPGERIFAKGDPSNAMYIVAEGRVCIHDGDYVFTELGQPASFGEYALVDNSRRTASATASATACERTVVVRLDRKLFHRSLRKNSEFLRGLLCSLLQRIVEKDLTEEEIDRTREAICRQRAELAKMNAVKSRFFNMIAHDLKNPLMALSVMSRALAEHPAYLTPEKAQEYANLVHEAASIACRLMENLLDWSRAQSNSIEFRTEPVSVHQTVCDNFALLNVCAQQKRITLSNRVPESLRVMADARSVSAIVRNLVGNALKYTGTGGSITVAATPVEGDVEFSVTDSGVGIDPERIEGLFCGDVISSTRGTADEMGTGLGLKLCKEFAEKNRGDIRVTSEVGRGTTFTVRLPGA